MPSYLDEFCEFCHKKPAGGILAGKIYVDTSLVIKVSVFLILFAVIKLTLKLRSLDVFCVTVITYFRNL